MTLGNSPQEHTLLRLEQRKSYALGVNFVHRSDNSLVDLTGATLRLIVRKPKRWGYDIVIDIEAEPIGSPSTGQMQFLLQSSDLDLEPASYSLTATLVSANAYQTTVLKGTMEILVNDDPDITGTFPAVTPENQLTAYIENGDVVTVSVNKVDGPESVVSVMLNDAAAYVTAAQAAADSAADHDISANNAAEAGQTFKDDAEAAAAAALASANAASGHESDAQAAATSAEASANTASTKAGKANTHATIATNQSVNAKAAADAALAYRDQAEGFKEDAEAAAAAVSGDIVGVVNNGDFVLTGSWDFTGADVEGVATEGGGAVESVNGQTGVVIIPIPSALENLTETAASQHYSQADETKLAGIATGATANNTNLYLLTRNNHLGTQSADTLTDGTTNKAYTASEKTKLSGVATGATANSADATLLARANHTGTQSADTLTDGTTNKAYTATEKTKLSGIATGATANSSDATLLSRANHTGSQAISTVTDLQTELDDLAEAISDGLDLKQDAGYAGMLPGTTITMHRVAGVWPARPHTRTDCPVFWAGPDPDPSLVSSPSTAGMYSVDKRLVHS